jgi:hypothetical protein
MQHERVITSGFVKQLEARSAAAIVAKREVDANQFVCVELVRRGGRPIARIGRWSRGDSGGLVPGKYYEFSVSQIPCMIEMLREVERRASAGAG